MRHEQATCTHRKVPEFRGLGSSLGTLAVAQVTHKNSSRRALGACGGSKGSESAFPHQPCQNCKSSPRLSFLGPRWLSRIGEVDVSLSVIPAGAPTHPVLAPMKSRAWLNVGYKRDMGGKAGFGSGRGY